MHIKDGELRAYIDKELAIERNQEVVQHLEACPNCRERLTLIQSNVELAKVVFPGVNVDEPNTTLSTQTARTRLRHKIDQKEKMPMWRKLMNSKQRPVYIGLVVVLLFAVAFSFPQVRAAANSFLGLFRVQQVTIIQSAFTMDEVPEQMEQKFLLLEDMLENQMEFEIGGEIVEVETIAEAEELAGFDVRVPEEELVSRIEYQPQVEASIVVDRDLWQSLVEQMGYDLALPEEIDGAEVSVTLPNAVMTYLGECDYRPEEPGDRRDADFNCSMLTQMPTPSVEAPEGLDLKALGLIYLQLAGVSAEDAEAFSKDIEWTNTLVIPVPQDADAREIRVDGVDGYVFEDGPRGRYFSMIWLRDGIVYVLSGNNRAHQTTVTSGLE